MDGCGCVKNFNEAVGGIICAAVSTQSQCRERQGRRLSGTRRFYGQLEYIAHEFERFKPSCWYLGSFLLCVRLSSKAMMFFWDDQVAQVQK
jgi:hypothetical protein